MISLTRKDLQSFFNDLINGYLQNLVYRLIILSIHYSDNLGYLTTDSQHWSAKSKLLLIAADLLGFS